MRKKHIFLSIALGVATLGGITTALVLNQNDNNTNIEIKNEKLPFDAKESTNILDDKLDIFEDVAFEAKLNQSNESIDITSPKMGVQKAVYNENNKNYIALRYYAAITSLDVNAMWTRKIYDGNNVLKNESTIQSSKAYSSVTCNSETIYPESLGSEYKYFVIYTMYDIPEEASDYTLDLMVTLSNDNKSISSKTVSAQTSEAGSVNSYEMNISLHKTSGKDGTYTTNSVKTIYKIGEDINTNNILASDESGNNLSIELDSSVNTTTLGRKNVILKSNRYQASYDIYVLDTNGAYINEDGSYVVTVNQNYNGNIGEVNGVNGNMFTTISQALEYLSNSDFVNQTKNKILNISAGYYFEKLDINTPNLTINGAGSNCHATYYESENDKDVDYDADKFNSSTIIEYDSLYGIEEVDGFIHSTNSTQTVQVNKNAVNCKINNVVISNKYNNIKAFSNTSYAGNGERGLALLVKSDQFVIENSAILGWQDTLELFTGRQYFKNVYITGAVDYIFGTNSTTLFDGCTINTVKSKTSYINENQNTAYITATKGNHSNDNDYINYGLIFNECNFTTSSDYVGKYAIARPWYKYSAVAVINSTFNNKVLTNESETIKTGLINDVNIDTLKIKFYGNNVSFIDDLANVNTELTSSEALDYTNYKKIFAKKNGGVSYDLAWDPINGVETKNQTYYYFDANEGESNSYMWREDSAGSVNTTWNGLEINTSKCKYNSDKGGYTELQSGTISFEVEANSLVTIKTGFGSGTNYSITGYDINDNTLALTDTLYPESVGNVSYYFNQNQKVVMNITGKVYLLGIVITSNDDDHEDTINSISVKGNPTNEIEINTELDLSGLIVKANYTNNAFKVLDSSEYSIDTSNVDITKAGTYEITVTYGNFETSFNVTYVSVINNTISESIITSFKGGNYSNYNAVVYGDTFDSSSQDVMIDKITYSGGIKSNSSADNWISIKKGSSITLDVSGACALYLGFYNSTLLSASTVKLNGNTISKYRLFNRSDKLEIESLRDGQGDFARYVISNAGTITITFSGNGYLGAVGVLFNDGITDVVEPSIIDSNTTLELNSSNTDLSSKLTNNILQGSKLVYGNFTIDATADNAKLALNGDNAQFNTGTKISFAVAAGATVKVTGYSGASSYSLTGSESADSEQIKTVTYTTKTDVEIVATDNKYIKSIEITFPYIIESNTDINFGTVGNYSQLISSGVISSTATIKDNGENSNNSMVYGGNIEFYVAAGSTVKVYGNNSVNYVANGEVVSGSGLSYDAGQHVVKPDENGKVTIECDTQSHGNNYFYYIKITF